MRHVRSPIYFRRTLPSRIPSPRASPFSRPHDAHRGKPRRLRIKELLSWTVGQVLNREGEVAREITVTRALLKGGSDIRKRNVRSRRVVLNERPRDAIKAYLSSLGSVPASNQFLFRSREGGNRLFSGVQAHRILARLCRECGVSATRVSTHSLRKTFVRVVYDASGHDLVVTQRHWRCTPPRKLLLATLTAHSPTLTTRSSGSPVPSPRLRTLSSRPAPPEAPIRAPRLQCNVQALAYTGGWLLGTTNLQYYVWWRNDSGSAPPAWHILDVLESELSQVGASVYLPEQA